MAGTDFSTHTYSYDDFPGDDTLSNFSLTEEDFLYKVAYISTISSDCGAFHYLLFVFWKQQWLDSLYYLG